MVLTITVWHNSKIEALIVIEAIEDLCGEPNKDSREFIDTLASALAISLEEISFKTALEARIQERSMSLEQANKQLEYEVVEKKRYAEALKVLNYQIEKYKEEADEHSRSQRSSL